LSAREGYDGGTYSAEDCLKSEKRRCGGKLGGRGGSPENWGGRGTNLYSIMERGRREVYSYRKQEEGLQTNQRDNREFLEGEVEMSRESKNSPGSSRSLEKSPEEEEAKKCRSV